MLKALSIRGYRGFESYQVADLVRVNLIVGKNNCGKTSILEAIHLLVSGGNLSVFNSVGKRRNEVSRRYVTRPGGWSMDFSHIFFGHKFDCDASFHLLSDNGGRSLTVKVISLDEVKKQSYFWNSRIEQPAQNYLFEEDEDPTPIYALRIEENAYEECVEIPALKGGTVVFDRLPVGMRD